MAQMTLSDIKRATPALSTPPEMQSGFGTVGGFELMQRGARLLSASTLVPTAYRAQVQDKRTKNMVANPAAISNCVVALNMAQRLGADPLMVMQNLYIVEGRPAWSAQFVIAAINACGKFSPLRFDVQESAPQVVTWTEKVWENGQSKSVTKKAEVPMLSCRAWATELSSGEKLEGPTVSMEMAVKEGWYGKNGSKWQTMPEMMLRYRAASFFGKLYAPDLLMGLQTAEELRDSVITIDPDVMDEGQETSMTTAELMAAQESPAVEVTEEHAEPEPEPAPAAKRPKAKKPAAEPEPELDPEPEPEQEEEVQHTANLITCPKNDRQVDELDCLSKPCHDGCPAFE